MPLSCTCQSPYIYWWRVHTMINQLVSGPDQHRCRLWSRNGNKSSEHENMPPYSISPPMHRHAMSSVDLEWSPSREWEDLDGIVTLRSASLSLLVRGIRDRSRLSRPSSCRRCTAATAGDPQHFSVFYSVRYTGAAVGGGEQRDDPLMCSAEAWWYAGRRRR